MFDYWLLRDWHYRWGIFRDVVPKDRFLQAYFAIKPNQAFSSKTRGMNFQLFEIFLIYSDNFKIFNCGKRCAVKLGKIKKNIEE